MLFKGGLGYMIGVVIIVGGLLTANPIGVVVGIVFLVLQPAGDAKAQEILDDGEGGQHSDDGCMGWFAGFLLPAGLLVLLVMFFLGVAI